MAVVMSPNLARMFDERLKRIVEESYEVAFILCNKEMEEFSSSKIFDIFTQVFSTAYVLNTGYWPFFSTINGQCLCVCGRFGVPCRHIRNGGHWIDLQPIESDPSAAIFYPKMYGPVIIQDYEVLVKPLDSTGGYHINIILNVQYKRIDKGKIKKEKPAKPLQKDVTSKTYPISIFSRFFLMNQFYSALFTIVFQPNPFFNEHYGTLFRKLINLRAQEFCAFHGEQRQIWCITYNQMPSTTFVHHHVNVPVYKFPTQLLVFNTTPSKNKNPLTKNKSVQTYTVQQSSLSSSTSQNIWGNYCIEESSTISESLKNFASNSLSFVNSETEEYIIIDDSEEFDNQWPSLNYNKVIQPNQFMIEYNCMHATLLDNEPQDLTSKQSSKYTWSPKTEPDSTTTNDSLSNSEQELSIMVQEELTSVNLNFSKVVSNVSNRLDEKSDGKDENWFEKNFPPLKGLTIRKMAKSEVDEEFEIIQNVIKDDVLKQEGNLDWWHKNIKQ